MKVLFLVLFVIITSCSRKSGTTQGVLVDAAKEGVIFTSCEIDVQYGKESSRIESFSHSDPSTCDELSELIGQDVQVKYHYENWPIRTNDGHIIDNIVALP